MAVSSTSPAIATRSVTQSAIDKLDELYHWEGFRQAVRVALAMMIAYYISLAMGWDRPQWAGLAVALCSLATVGDSINKGLLRILGTFLAGSVALVLAAVFPQDRFLYLLTATLYIAFCAYMMGSTSRWYVWFIGGYVMALLAMAGGPEGGTLFETIILRLQQTTMGLVVYLIVSSLLWPVQAAPVLDRVAGEALAAHRALIGDCRARLTGTVAADAAQNKGAAAARTVKELAEVQNGAELDSFDVWDKRHQWRRVAADLASLNDLLETTRHTIGDLKGLDLSALGLGHDQALEKIENRLWQIERMIAGDRPERDLPATSGKVDSDAIEALAHFDRAAVLIFLDLIGQIDRLTKQLFDTVADIRSFGPATTPEAVPDLGGSSALDPDRLAAGLRTFIALWLILFACMFIPGLPMPPGVVPMVAAAAIQLSVFPQMPLSATLGPGLAATLLAWLFHVFAMPHLHTYVGLGVGIFLVIFFVMILMAKPEHAIGRPIVTSFFVMVVSVQNEQTYNPTFAMNYAIAFVLALATIWVASLFPVSYRPQAAFLGRLERFFTSCSRLAGSVRAVGEAEVTRPFHAFDLQEARRLPGKIRPWLGRQPAVTEGRMDRHRLDALADGLDMLSLRLRHLLDLRRLDQAEALRNELRDDVRSWRLAIQEILHGLAQDPTMFDAAALRDRLDAKLASFTERVEATINGPVATEFTDEELANMYFLLGGHRGLCEALVVVADRAGAIDWDAVREERF